MTLETVFRFSMLSVAALAGGILAGAEERPFPAGFTVLMCVLSLFFNERLRTIRLPLVWCNVLGLAALGVSTYEFFGESLDARLTSGAHFLVYLTWIVLFQDKRPSQYWWLLALGTLQVAVAAVMTISSEGFGILLLAYLLLALWTMAVFHLYRGAVAYGEAAGSQESPEVEGTTAAHGMASGVPTEARWGGPLTTIEHAIQQDHPGRWITGRFTAGALSIAVAGLGLGLVLFLLVPRYWIGNGNPFASHSDPAFRALTGFSNEVRLGHLGNILERSERVFQLRLYNNDTHSPIDLDQFVSRHGMQEPLFRGNVLDMYERGRWSNSGGRRRLANMQSHPREDGMIRQEYTLDALGSDVLFCLRPIQLGAYTPYEQITVDPESLKLVVRDSARNPIQYLVWSQPYVPATGSATARRGQFADLPAIDRDELAQRRRARYVQLPDNLERLQALAADWTRSIAPPAGGDAPPPRRIAETIERRLRDSGEFTYSLKMGVIDPEIDPVEDFLVNRKSGHCEYFASSLALLLRSVGIPARLITGFKGAEYFKSGGYYEVQQRHAHAWVEAYLDNEWVSLDATPAARDDSVKNFGSDSSFWKNATSSLSSFWATYVVNMSLSRQEESLYDPIKSSLSEGLAPLKAVVTELLQGGSDGPSAKSRWSGMGVVFLGLVALGLGVMGTRRLRRHGAILGSHSTGAASRWPAWWRRLWGPPRDRRVAIELYERFLTVVATQKLRPQDPQTPREFSQEVARALAELLTQEGLESLPDLVTQWYYGVRFGGAPPLPAQVAQFDGQLSQLAAALRTSSGGSRKGRTATASHSN
ncbi:MAG: transglutaminaseTgpA domain-containing protein [Planctomycetales bacterium]